MNSYLLQLSGREEGPYTDVQIAQMFAEGIVNKHTLCKTDRLSDWRTVDEFLPTLKYGSELPAQVPISSVTTTPSLPARKGIVITDINVPFNSVLRMVFKIAFAWIIVSICLLPILFLVWLLAAASVISFFGHFFH